MINKYYYLAGHVINERIFGGMNLNKNWNQSCVYNIIYYMFIRITSTVRQQFTSAVQSILSFVDDYTFDDNITSHAATLTLAGYSPANSTNRSRPRFLSDQGVAPTYPTIPTAEWRYQTLRARNPPPTSAYTPENAEPPCGVKFRAQRHASRGQIFPRHLPQPQFISSNKLQSPRPDKLSVCPGRTAAAVHCNK